MWPRWHKATCRFSSNGEAAKTARPTIRKAARRMSARIYQPPKNAMQSGRSGIREWVLEFAPGEAKRADPLMGWAGSGDTQEQVRLRFPTCAAAQAYATRHGIAASVVNTPERRLKLQSYAENFR
jgi:hypothetical protein